MWANKYEPSCCSEILLNKSHIKHLKNLIYPSDSSNLIIYGPKGSGKKFLIKHIMTEKIGIDLFDFTNEIYIANNESKSSCTILQNNSNTHLSLYLQKYGSCDKYIISDYLKRKIETMCISEHGKLSYKTIILYNLDFLSKVAQDILRKLLETYYRSSRFIFTTSNINVILPSLKSRCHCYRIGHVYEDELLTYMNEIMIINNMKSSKINNKQIIELHERNIESCINHLHYINVTNTKTLDTPITDCYERILNNIVNKSKFKLIRDLLYILLTNNIDGTEILKGIYKTCLPYCKEDNKIELTKIVAIYEYRTAICERPIYHIEGFIQNIICKELLT